MNRICIALILLVLSGLSVVGCSSEETKTVEWYVKPENKAALDAKLAECKNNPGELGNTPNCVNAVRLLNKSSLAENLRK